MKLKSSIPSNSVKLIELYNKINSGSLITGPDYQRKLVWKKQHKYAFIETILLNFPFPEIYIASAEMDMDKLQSREVVVDGQQRLTTIVDYIKGKGDFSNAKNIKSFDSLSSEEKKDFLNYLVSVKDLKDIGEENTKEVFKRINSTDYSLNSNEILNAEYGGGEFAIFCKLLADKTYKPTEKETDIILENELRDLVSTFFLKNNVFSENDIKRMFDSQYIMLISSTLLEGKYFGRNSKINFYLEKYNLEFSIHTEILKKLINSITIISKLKLSENSYWFNKANLFTLLFELSAIIETNLDLAKLEQNLIDLENKVDVYFNGDEDQIKLLTSDETKFFEVSRQGSHELSSREHRGKVIKELINKSLNFTQLEDTTDDVYSKNIYSLKELSIPYSLITPTATGLVKSVMDATSAVREFLNEKNIHDYEKQNYGPTHKVKIKGQFILQNMEAKETEISLYRSNGRGDFRIWFTDLKEFASANDELGIILIGDKISILNFSKFDYTDFISKLK
jgi:hypothetical protein